MTTPQRFERDLPTLLAERYVSGMPEYRDELVRQIATTRQRPAWTFPGRWLPMDITTQAVPAGRMPWRTLGILALIGLLIAAAAAAYVGSSTRLPDPFGIAANGRLAYVSDGDVFVRDRVDGAARPLITGPETETYALFSPQGARLAVLRAVDGGEDLYVGGADADDLRRVGGPYSSGDWVDWSPDGSHVAIGHTEAGVPVIDVVAADGSGSRRVADFPAMSPTWRPPDGRQLLFRGQRDGRWGFFLLDVAGGGDPVRLALEGDGVEGSEYDLRGPAWSPTGDRLAYDSLVRLPESQLGTPGLRVHVATLGPSGELLGEVQRLEFDARADDELNALFTPDGRSLVFQQRFGWTPPDPARGTPTVDRAFIAPADGSGPARDLGVVSTNGDGLALTIAPDGTSVIVHLWKEGEDWQVDPTTGTASLTELGSLSGVSWQRRAP